MVPSLYQMRRKKLLIPMVLHYLCTSSPHYPQINGLAERTIQIIKELLQDSPDPYLALLSFRTTLVLWCSFSPADLLMWRQLRTDIPTPKNQLIPQWSYLQEFQEKDNEYKTKQRRDYNDKHRVKPLDPLLPDTPVWIRTEQSQTTGYIQSPANTPRYPTLSPLQMAKSLEELTKPYTQVTSTDTFLLWSFSEATRPIDTVTQPCKKGRCGVTEH